MDEIWSTEGSAAPPKTTIKRQKREVSKTAKKSRFFLKWRCSSPSTSIAPTFIETAWRVRIFRLYIPKWCTSGGLGQMQKTGISVTFGLFGAFTNLWRHTLKRILSVIIHLVYRSNDQLFCSRTHSFGWERLHRLSWRLRKVHRTGDYNAAHFELCRIAWRPPGHPRRLSLVRDERSSRCWVWVGKMVKFWWQTNEIYER